MTDSKKGFTLVELLLAVFILAGAVGGALLLITTSMMSSQQAWDTTVAVTHAEHVLEEMQVIDSMEIIRSKDWDSWIEGQKLNTLQDEKIQIVFSGEDIHPMDIEVTVNWVTKSRENQFALNTTLSK